MRPILPVAATDTARAWLLFPRLLWHYRAVIARKAPRQLHQYAALAGRQPMRVAQIIRHPGRIQPRR